MEIFIQKIEKGNELIKEGQIEEAIVFFAELMEEFPEEPLVFYNSAIAFIEKENFEISEKLLTHCLNLGYNNHRVFLGLGYCHLKKNELEISRTFFSKIKEGEESFLESLIGIVYSFILEGKISDTKPFLEILKKSSFWNQELRLVERTLRTL